MRKRDTAKLCWHHEIFTRGNIGFQNIGKLEICIERENMDVGETSLMCTWTSSIFTVHKHTIPKAACFHLSGEEGLAVQCLPGHLVESVSDKKPKNRVMQRCSDNEPV
jgi:hypothetical protein